MRIRLSLLVVICLVTLLLWGGRWYLEGGLRNQASAPVTGVAWTPDATTFVWKSSRACRSGGIRLR